MTFWDIANAPLLWILVGAGLLFVFLLALVFFVRAWKRCIHLGLSTDLLKKITVSSMTFSVVPSLSIVIGLITLSAVLGIPWAWFRLSVVGAVTYELMAANMTANGMGYENLTLAHQEPAVVMTAVMIVMSIGILAGIISNIFAAKKITTSLVDYNKRQGGWGALFSGCFMMTMIAVFLVVESSKGMVSFLTLLTSLIVAYGISFIAKKYKIAWLGEFVLAITLILGMASAVMWTALVPV